MVFMLSHSLHCGAEAVPLHSDWFSAVHSEESGCHGAEKSIRDGRLFLFLFFPLCCFCVFLPWNISLYWVCVSTCLRESALRCARSQSGFDCMCE